MILEQVLEESKKVIWLMTILVKSILRRGERISKGFGTLKGFGKKASIGREEQNRNNWCR